MDKKTGFPSVMIAFSTDGIYMYLYFCHLVVELLRNHCRKSYNIMWYICTTE